MNGLSMAATAETEAEIEEITVDEFYRRISQPNDILLLDVRNDRDFENWRIESRYTPETMHIPYIIFAEDGPAALDELPELMAVPDDREIIAVCAKGGASDFVAAILRDEGKRAVNLIDGMIAWGNYHTVRTVAEEATYQIYQVDRVARGCLSHVLISDGQAAIIDPLRHIEHYEKLLEEKGAKLTMLLDTHAHADHISGAPALAQKSGAPYYLHPYDAIHPFDMLPAVIDYQMLDDGQKLTLGDLSIEVIHTPGHTLGQVNYLVSEPSGQAYVFTGDNIFLQSFGRPDLGGQGESWAPIVYDTIFRRMKERVADDTWLLPGHYASFSEANEQGVYIKRMGDLWQENSGLQFANRDHFIAYVLTHLPKMPEQYIEIKRVNIGLSQPDEQEASELELGKNVCALSDAYGS
ncbi:MAG: MBL fold metallo-hydrolase [Chloroflexota bacterium]|jgi:glyoxylase-like metal-dependent hydrolase (beta-lactamase superfamily II)/rhodanese-related sulfurtransferase